MSCSEAPLTNAVYLHNDSHTQRTGCKRVVLEHMGDLDKTKFPSADKRQTLVSLIKLVALFAILQKKCTKEIMTNVCAM